MRESINTKGYNKRYSSRFARSKAIASNNSRIKLILIILGLSLIITFTFVKNANAASNAKLQYTSVEIQDGDSVYNICREYYSSDNDDFNAYVNKVIKLNHLSSDGYIHEGQSIVIPYYSSN